jgi:hypothetical protein
MRTPKWPGGSLNFQFNRTVISPDGRISASRIKTPRPAEYKIMEKGSKTFAGGPLGVIANGPTAFATS